MQKNIRHGDIVSGRKKIPNLQTNPKRNIVNVEKVKLVSTQKKKYSPLKNGPNASFSRQNSVISSNSKSVTRPQDHQSLPEDCFFINEKRDELPSDAVELAKLKLIKQRAIKNLKRTIKEIKDQSAKNNPEGQIVSLNTQIAELDSKIRNLDQRLKTLEELKKQKPSEGRADK